MNEGMKKPIDESILDQSNEAILLCGLTPKCSKQRLQNNSIDSCSLRNKTSITINPYSPFLSLFPIHPIHPHPPFLFQQTLHTIPIKLL